MHFVGHRPEGAAAEDLQRHVFAAPQYFERYVIVDSKLKCWAFLFADPTRLRLSSIKCENTADCWYAMCIASSGQAGPLWAELARITPFLPVCTRVVQPGRNRQ